MITVSVRQLVDAIEESDAYMFPGMSGGTEYLYDHLYKRLSRGEDVALSSLDFDAFGSEDIDSLNSLHSDVLGRNQYIANGIAATLRQVAPIRRAVGYV